MSLLRQELDDPGLAGDSSWACGRCDSCAGPWYEPSVSPEALEAARSHLGRAGLELEPRKLWPTSMKSLGVDLSGKIAAAEAAATGRAIARLTDIGWGNTCVAANRLKLDFRLGSGRPNCEPNARPLGLKDKPRDRRLAGAGGVGAKPR